jgi:hypothetical protein
MQSTVVLVVKVDAWSRFSIRRLYKRGPTAPDQYAGSAAEKQRAWIVEEKLNFRRSDADASPIGRAQAAESLRALT